MSLKDLAIQTDTLTLAPIVIAGDGTDVDCTSVDGKNAVAVRHILSVGESGDAWGGALYTDVILEESDDNSTFTAVTASADFIGTMETQTSGIIKVLDAEADDNANYEITYVGTKRYTQIALNKTGNHATGTPMSCNAIVMPRLQGSLSPT